MLRLSVIALLVLLVSCGGSKTASKSPASAPAEGATTGAGSPMPEDPHKEIKLLEVWIGAASLKLELDKPNEAAISAAPTVPLGALPSTQDTKCHPAQNDTCKTSCTLSDSICLNADKICNIAKTLPGDNWALNKCAKANATCESSKTKCCGCQ